MTNPVIRVVVAVAEEDDEVVTWFWDVVLELNTEKKKKLLMFTTGCDRVPIGGIENDTMLFIIMRHGEGDERLPCAQTCFNLVLLPQYTNKERLKEALLIAIENSEGFGLA